VTATCKVSFGNGQSRPFDPHRVTDWRRNGAALAATFLRKWSIRSGSDVRYGAGECLEALRCAAQLARKYLKDMRDVARSENPRLQSADRSLEWNQ